MRMGTICGDEVGMATVLMGWMGKGKMAQWKWRRDENKMVGMR